MKKLIPILSLLGLLATPAFAGAPSPKARTAISSTDAMGLRSLEAPGLGGLRAGVSEAQRTISPVERASLATAAARDAGDLGALRGGDVTLSDRDIQIIVVVAVVVLILVLI
jgi:hypothetical protein